MKKLIVLISGILATLLIACSGSDTYRGSWKAMDQKGDKFDIIFETKNFIVKDSAGGTKKHEYTQHSYQSQNSIKTYGIQLDDGRTYQIHFPKGDSDSIGLIKDENGHPMYTISRKAYITYDDIYKLE